MSQLSVGWLGLAQLNVQLEATGLASHGYSTRVLSMAQDEGVIDTVIQRKLLSW